MRWANFFHIYQPPRWPTAVIRKVSREAYRPLVRFLLANKNVRLTLNVSGSLTEQLFALPDQRDVLVGLRALLSRKQIELTDSAMYHAILPLLQEPEIIRQIKLNHHTNRRIFGPAYKPAGFFPPEMAFSPALGRILAQLGYRWVILDGISHPGIVDYTVRSIMRGTNMAVVFRNRFMSDYLAFEAQARDRKAFLNTARRWNGQSSLLLTGMDGENLGHHRHEAKRLWQSLVQLPSLTTITMSECINFQEPAVPLSPRAATWSSKKSDLERDIPFTLWKNPTNRLHRMQWQLFSLVTQRVRAIERRSALPMAIRREVDQSVASDWYWWASREPWWDVDIIITAAHQLETLAHELNMPKPMFEKVQRLVRDIMSTAHRWQDGGSAQRHAQSFLAAGQTPRYLGGTKVHYSLTKSRTS